MNRQVQIRTVLKRVFSLASAKPFLAALGLGVLVATNLWVNTDVFSKSSSAPEGQRTMASVADTDTQSQEFAQRLAKSSRAPASLGRQPTALEQLIFGQLKGKYIVDSRQDKLFGLKLSPKATPEAIGDTDEFVRKLAPLLPVGEVLQIKRLNSQANGIQYLVRFSEPTLSKKQEASIKIELDNNSRLLTLSWR